MFYRCSVFILDQLRLPLSAYFVVLGAFVSISAPCYGISKVDYTVPITKMTQPDMPHLLVDSENPDLYYLSYTGLKRAGGHASQNSG